MVPSAIYWNRLWTKVFVFQALSGTKQNMNAPSPVGHEGLQASAVAVDHQLLTLSPLPQLPSPHWGGSRRAARGHCADASCSDQKTHTYLWIWRNYLKPVGEITKELLSWRETEAFSLCIQSRRGHPSLSWSCSRVLCPSHWSISWAKDAQIIYCN